ncbi:MAG: sialate O-acetylesterase [Bacteroidales bacterium]
MKKILFVFNVLFLISCGSEKKSNIALHGFFGDHMVIQRNKPVVVKGYALPGTRMEVEMNGLSENGKAGADSTWKVSLPPMLQGGPHQLIVKAPDTTLHVNDILIGDLWICSGQSNMEWPLHNSLNGSEELAQLNYPNLRVMNIPKDMEFFPVDDIRNPVSWFPATSDTIKNFSAVGFYFGKEVLQNQGVPVGLIGSNWGGTVVETWMSTDAIQCFPEFSDKLEFIQDVDMSVAELTGESMDAFEQWRNENYYNGPGFEQNWYLPETNTSDWKEIQVPGYWEDANQELKDFNGAIWYRKEIEIPAEFVDKDIKLWLSRTDDHDIAWFNGKKLGESYFNNQWTNYVIPASLLKEGRNTLVIRIFDVQGKGGFTGIPEYFDYHPVNDRSLVMNSSGTWMYKKGQSYEGEAEQAWLSARIDKNDYPSLLYNAMIHPIIDFPVKGVIWYQGESNASRAYQYRELFPAMIENWRNKWENGDLSFYFVQLANFKERKPEPVESAWAELREAQTNALELPNTGMATIIDIGEANDIHPRNKRDVGKRLALNALAITYGIDTTYSGPMYASHEVSNGAIMVSFNHVNGGLTTSNGGSPLGFEIATEKGQFYKANAEIVDRKIKLTSPAVSNPKEVRYAWADNPEVNLYNMAGLPAVPFRTDIRKGITHGLK